MTDKMRKIPEVALGAWAWGSKNVFGTELSKEMLKTVFDTAMQNGLYLWDTAYVYGWGRAERILADFLRDVPDNDYILSDKFTPRCADMSSATPLKDMIEMQLENMNRQSFDIYWIHNASDAPRWTKELAEYFEGCSDVPMIGVSNHNLEEIQQAEKILKAHGLKLSAVQNHFSIINRFSEATGILDYCHEKELFFFSYMVLEQGALSGKYDETHLMPEGSDRAKIYNPMLGKISPLNQMLQELAEKYAVMPAQIPVAWAIGKGTVPIIGVTSPAQVEGAAKAGRVILTEGEVRDLEKLADSLDLDVNRFWERQMR